MNASNSGSRLAPEKAPPLVLVGSDALAARLVEELAKLEESGVAQRPGGGSRLAVTVLVNDVDGPFVPHMREHGARIRTGSARDEAVLKAVGVETAAALVLLLDDDVANLHAALTARAMNPRVRLVIRTFDERLAGRMRDLFGADCAALSASFIAAPSFVDAALGDGQQLIEIGGRTLNAGPPSTVSASPLVTLATDDPGAADGFALLPGDTATGAPQLVLGEPVAPALGGGTGRRWRLPRGLPRWVSGRLRWTLALLSALVVIGTVVLHSGLPLSWIDAFYAMVSAVTTGGPDQLKSAGSIVTLFTAASMLAGVVLIALITAFAVDDLVGRRTSGPPVGRVSQHVVVCGLGTVGLRIVEQLRAAGAMVVGVEREPDALIASTARRLGVPLVRGDASEEPILRAARADRARSVVVATDDDVANVEIGLAVWALDQDVRIVLRLFDQELSDRITGALPHTQSLSVSAAAAPVFLAAIMGREVQAAVGHGRRVLLVAEVAVGADSPLDGKALAELDRPGSVRVFGQLRTIDAARTPGSNGRTRTLVWMPRKDALARAGDVLYLVATRTGLADALLQTGASTDNGVLGDALTDEGLIRQSPQDGGTGTDGVALPTRRSFWPPLDAILGARRWSTGQRPGRGWGAGRRGGPRANGGSASGSHAAPDEVAHNADDGVPG